MAILTIKKVGNHWYPDIPHTSGADISLSPNTDRFLNLLGAIKNTDKFTLYIDEVPWVTDENKIIYVNEEDLTRYYVTDDYFTIRFTVGGNEFGISVYLYYCLSTELDLNLHTGLCQISFV